MPAAFPSTPFYTTTSGIAYAEMPGFRATFSDDQTTLVRQYCCLWDDWFDFALDMLGFDEYTSGNLLTRYLPQADPEVNGFWCEALELVNAVGRPMPADGLDCLKYVDPSSNPASEGMAVFTASFRAPLYAVLSDEEVAGETIPELARNVIRTTEDAIESLQLPTASLRWKSDGQAVPQTAGILFPTAVYRLAWLRVPVEAEPANTIAATLGKVNNATFDGRPAGTLLMMPPTRRLYQHANSYTYLDITYALNYRATGWNYFFDPGTGTYREVERAGSPGVGAYESADFSLLFDPSAG